MSTVSNSEKVEVSEILETATPQKRRSLPNILLRLITGLVLMPVIIIIVRLGSWPLMFTIGFLMFNGILEFYFMERERGLQNNAIIGIVAATMILLAYQYHKPILWQSAVVLTILITFALEFVRGRIFKNSVWRIVTTVAGIFYIAFPLAFLIAIRQADWGFHWFFAVLFSTWGTDTLAYLTGNMFGKTKLAPTLSPGKTVEGAIGGLVFGALMPLLVLRIMNEATIAAAVMCIIATFAATGGDLLESAIKRFFGVKDSHVPGFNIFPGHGGVLDRIDSTLAVATVYYIYLIWIGKITFLI
jgi:phosphatidate cytidylyltransferase